MKPVKYKRRMFLTGMGASSVGGVLLNAIPFSSAHAQSGSFSRVATKNGMKKQELDPILNCSANKFYWECKNNCDGCIYYEIDAKTGKIIGQGKVVFE
jgi:hypothetical protein